MCYTARIIHARSTINTNKENTVA
uniref:Uncharacterized protein n=1 Tax=Arundo donax TaxID=35708 RepID=A0A0A9HB66_ARUDO